MLCKASPPRRSPTPPRPQYLSARYPRRRLGSCRRQCLPHVSVPSLRRHGSTPHPLAAAARGRVKASDYAVIPADRPRPRHRAPGTHFAASGCLVGCLRLGRAVLSSQAVYSHGQHAPISTDTSTTTRTAAAPSVRARTVCSSHRRISADSG
ncbi:hypothetical protein FA95DRAFT_577843 [Auriscalpium vulgare]|uniref:Uncharacterized protein n=1 Tax=Auriscalpium vulgare TaxID=40419 RepID=A0ACB8S3B8_9AGAM|nr:hypothetical protein FA95DRAFT_577843 [Auriscalpium vulgare]